MERDLTLDSKHLRQYAGDVLLSCILESCMVLLTQTFPINSIFKKGKKHRQSHFRTLFPTHHHHHHHLWGIKSPIFPPHTEWRTPLPAQSGSEWAWSEEIWGLYISLLTQVPRALLSFLHFSHIPPRGTEEASAVVGCVAPTPSHSTLKKRDRVEDLTRRSPTYLAFRLPLSQSTR